MSTRVAAVDCGTNSIRLLVADVDRAGLTDVDRRMEIVRLGQGVDQTGRLAPEALDRTIGALRGFAKIINETGASAVRMVATSATRDAENSAEFVSRVNEILGVPPDVLTGDEEARLSFIGATATVIGGPPYMVVDIGGGSTELVWGTADRVEAAISLDIGCVRMTERHLRDDPPTPAQIDAARADIDAALDRAAEVAPPGPAQTLVGLAGSVTTVAGIFLGLPAYDSQRIHNSVVPAPAVHGITESLLGQTHAERARIAVMHPGRVDVIGGGALVLDRVMRRTGFGYVEVSEHDILDGIAFGLAASS